MEIGVRAYSQSAGRYLRIAQPCADALQKMQAGRKGKTVTHYIQVLPVDDLKPHIESGPYCHCKPRLVREAHGTVAVHNAYDGREFYEENELTANTQPASAGTE